MIMYKGYIGAVDFDPEIDLFHGTVINTTDVITFYGASVTELREEMQKSVEGYLEFCREQGKMPEKPFSRKFTVQWTVTRVRDLVPKEFREHHESKHTCEEFYKRVADCLNLVEEKGWKLQPKFSKNYCSLFSEGGQGRKGRRVFGVRLNGYNPIRFYAIITKKEGAKLNNQYGCKMVSYTKSQAHYILRRDVKELLPVFEFAYNKHRGS